VYEGRPLSYVTSGGASTTISVANPIEAFAIAGSIYYTRPSWMPLPDWPGQGEAAGLALNFFNPLSGQWRQRC